MFAMSAVVVEACYRQIKKFARVVRGTDGWKVMIPPLFYAADAMETALFLTALSVQNALVEASMFELFRSHTSGINALHATQPEL